MFLQRLTFVVFWMKKNKINTIYKLQFPPFVFNFFFVFSEVDGIFFPMKLFTPVQQKVKFVAEKDSEIFDLFAITIFSHGRCIYTREPRSISAHFSTYPSHPFKRALESRRRRPIPGPISTSPNGDAGPSRAYR